MATSTSRVRSREGGMIDASAAEMASPEVSRVSDHWSHCEGGGDEESSSGDDVVDGEENAESN